MSNYLTSAYASLKTSSDVKYWYERMESELGTSARHFFDRATMRFFGDTMRSFGVRRIGETVYMYRKPGARVNCFGTWRTVVSDVANFGGVWRVDPEDFDLHGVHGQELDEIKPLFYPLF